MRRPRLSLRPEESAASARGRASRRCCRSDSHAKYPRHTFNLRGPACPLPAEAGPMSLASRSKQASGRFCTACRTSTHPHAHALNPRLYDRSLLAQSAAPPSSLLATSAGARPRSALPPVPKSGQWSKPCRPPVSTGLPSSHHNASMVNCQARAEHGKVLPTAMQLSVSSKFRTVCRSWDLRSG